MPRHAASLFGDCVGRASPAPNSINDWRSGRSSKAQISANCHAVSSNGLDIALYKNAQFTGLGIISSVTIRAIAQVEGMLELQIGDEVAVTGYMKSIGDCEGGSTTANHGCCWFDCLGPRRTQSETFRADRHWDWAKILIFLFGINAFRNRVGSISPYLFCGERSNGARSFHRVLNERLRSCFASWKGKGFRGVLSLGALARMTGDCGYWMRHGDT